MTNDVGKIEVHLRDLTKIIEQEYLKRNAQLPTPNQKGDEA